MLEANMHIMWPSTDYTFFLSDVLNTEVEFTDVVLSFHRNHG